MPRIRSAKKRVEVTERNRQRNAAQKSAIRTAVKKALEGAARKVDTTELQSFLNQAFSVIDRAVLKGVLKKNTAARYKSRVAKRVAQPA